ncbi:MAG: hypothetical protein AB8B60_15965 [Sulfitobacter sp.]
MASGGTPRTPKTKAEQRAERLKAALKANMGRRKAQARARDTQKNENKGAQSPTEESG